jgi:8-oxo-dGTP pyrophosphatase MutT (NUDIX family)
MKWQLISSDYLFNDTWLRARRDRCVRPDGKEVYPYYVMEYPTWVTALAITQDEKVLLVKQYRHAIGEVCIETPGGCVDATDTNYDEAIKREVLEETGYQFDDVTYLGRTSPNPSTNNNLMHMYLLQGGIKVQEQQLDANEDIEVLLITLDELFELLNRNELIQAMHVTTIFYALQKLGRLKIS